MQSAGKEAGPSRQHIVRRASLKDVRRAFDEHPASDQRESLEEVLQEYRTRNERPSFGDALRECWDIRRARRYGKDRAQRRGASTGPSLSVDEARRLTAELYPGYATGKAAPLQIEELLIDPPTFSCSFAALPTRSRTPSLGDDGIWTVGQDSLEVFRAVSLKEDAGYDCEPLSTLSTLSTRSGQSALSTLSTLSMPSTQWTFDELDAVDAVP
jgi:hypothetical protein